MIDNDILKNEEENLKFISTNEYSDKEYVKIILI